MKERDELWQQDAHLPAAPTAELFEESCQKSLKRAEGIFEKLKAGGAPSQAVSECLLAVNRFEWAIANLSSTTSLYQNVHPDPQVREVAERYEQKVSQLATEFSLSKEIYAWVSALNLNELSGDDRRYLEHLVRDFRRAGVDRDDATRARISALQEELVRLGQSFSKTIRDDVRHIKLQSVADMEGLPADYIAARRERLTITTDHPDLLPFMTYAVSDELRRALSLQNLQRGYPANGDILKTLLAKRHEFAKILGYESFADYLLETRMMKSAQAAQTFIDQISALAEHAMKRDYQVLLNRAQQDMPHLTALSGWQRAYYEEKVKCERFEFNSQTVRAYFPYQQVKEGILRLSETLFSLRFERDLQAETWHSSVEVYAVYTGDGANLIGRIYLDMHPREGKYKHAAQFDCRKGVMGQDGTFAQIPQGALICNFPEPNGASPALMEHHDVVTMFHEFGHLLHHVLAGRQTYCRFSGVATEWDFVEAPSQLFEEWAWSHDVLARFAKHFETGEVIPLELVTKMRAADEFGKGIQARVQMFYAALSLQYHAQDPQTFELMPLLQEIQARLSPFPYVQDTYLPLSFGHLEGYSAGYYTYMWSLVIAKELFTEFQKSGLLDPAKSIAYRDAILSRGGSRDAADLIHDFLARPYSLKAFERWLNQN